MLAALLVGFFHPVFFSNQTLRASDNFESGSHQTFVREAFASSGSWLERYPLWTPYIFSGLPSLGSLIAAPYTNPLSLLLFPLSGDVKVIAYYLVLAAATWLFLRRFGLSAAVALFGAVAFLFSTGVITWIMFGHNTKPSTAAFLPLVLLVTDRLWERPSARWAAVLTVSVGAMLLCSHVQIAYYALLAAGLYMTVATLHDRRRWRTPRTLFAVWGTWAAGIVSGVAASAVLYLPVLEYAPFSTRGTSGGGLPYNYATSWSLHPVEILTSALPSFTGFGGATYWGWMPDAGVPHYVGILVLFLASVSVVARTRERRTVFLIVLAVMAILLAFGRYFPALYRPFYEILPYFRTFRVPSMILVLFEFAVAGLAALGLGWLVRAREAADPSRATRVVRITAVAFAGLFAVVAALALFGPLESIASTRLAARLATPGGAVTPEVAERAAAAMRLILRDLGVATGVLGLGLACIWAGLRGRIPAPVMVSGVLLLTVLDLGRVGEKPAVYRARSEAAREPTPAIEFLRRDPEPFRVLSLDPDLGMNGLAYFGIPTIQGYHAASLQIYRDLTSDTSLGRMLARGTSTYSTCSTRSTCWLRRKSAIPTWRRYSGPPRS